MSPPKNQLDLSAISSQLSFGYRTGDVSAYLGKVLSTKNISAFIIGFLPISLPQRKSLNGAQVLSSRLGKHDSQKDNPLTYRNKISADNTNEAALYTEIKNAVDIMNAIPPLTFSVNPQNFRLDFEHAADYSKGRRSQITSMWLSKPQRLSISGVTSAQVLLSSDSIKSVGITHTDRTRTLSYKYLMDLIQIYRSNGIIYKQPSNGATNYHSGVPIYDGAVYISYGGNLYVGAFESMSLTDDSTKPHNFAYTLEFSVRFLTINSDRDV